MACETSGLRKKNRGQRYREKPRDESDTLTFKKFQLYACMLKPRRFALLCGKNSLQGSKTVAESFIDFIFVCAVNEMQCRSRFVQHLRGEFCTANPISAHI